LASASHHLSLVVSITFTASSAVQSIIRVKLHKPSSNRISEAVPTLLNQLIALLRARSDHLNRPA
jgi:hypothetical protein